MEVVGGFLDGKDMVQMFNMLRVNDFIWLYVVNNYLLGKDFKKFDFFYWNVDFIWMLQVFYFYYLREFY